jgi:hypothetical protein
MDKTSLMTAGFIAMTAAIVWTAPAAFTAPSGPALAIGTVEERTAPGYDERANRTRNKPEKSISPNDGFVFSPPVTAPQQTVDPFND